MSQQGSEGKYKSLGRSLKAMRARANESLAEASGAVEIDVRQLAQIELGDKRPSEDVLLLLISHFGAHDDEALQLWELAGYTTQKIPPAQVDVDFAKLDTADNRVLFTDVVDVTVNNYGVVMNFMQNNGAGGGPQSVARVGMSREHAKSILEILKVTLEQTEQSNRKMSHNPSADPKSD